MKESKKELFQDILEGVAKNVIDNEATLIFIADDIYNEATITITSHGVTKKEVFLSKVVQNSGLNGCVTLTRDLAKRFEASTQEKIIQLQLW